MLSISHYFVITLILILPPGVPQPQHHGNPPHGHGPSPPCEGEDDPHCVCNMFATLEYINEMANVPHAQARNEPIQDVVSRRIASYQCVRPHTLPETLRLKLVPEEGSESRRRYYASRRRMRVKRSVGDIDNREVDNRALDNQALSRTRSSNSTSTKRHRSRRQIALGYPSDELFFQILPKLETKSNHFYVPLGGGIKLPCGSGENSRHVIEGGSDGQEASSFKKVYEWSHSNGRPISSSEVSIDPKNGDLAFQSVSLSDSDLYSCEITTHPGQHDGGDVEESPPPETHYQQLDVVAEPVQWLRFVVEYYTPHCSRDELTLINSHLVAWVHTHVCFFCPVRNHSVACISDDVEWSEYDNSPLPSPDHKRVLIRLAVSTLGLERKMMAFSGYSEACPLPCIELLHVKILQIVRDSLEKLFKLKIQVETPEELSEYTPGSMSNDLVMACPSGFFAEHKLCFPCSPGQFSPNGNSECFPCAVGSFQPTPGSGMCDKCPAGYSTIDPGSVGEFDCKLDVIASAFHPVRLWRQYYPWSLYGAAALAILGLLLLLACIIPCLCPKTWMGRCCAGISCCGPDPDFEENTKRRPSYERIEYSEDDEGGENETRTRTRKIVELQETSSEGEALDEVRILPAQVLVDDENRVVEVDVVGEVDSARTGNIIIKDHFLYQPQSGRREEVQNYVTTKREFREIKGTGSKPKIPRPPPLPPATTSYWASTPKNSKLQQQTTFGPYKPKKFAKTVQPPNQYLTYRQEELEDGSRLHRNLGRYEILQQVSTPSPRMMEGKLPKLRGLEMDPTREDQRSKGVYIFSTDEDQRSQAPPKYHSVKEFTRKLDNSKGNRKATANEEGARGKKNVNFLPIPKTRLIPSRAEEKAAAYDDYIVGQVLSGSDHELAGGGDAQSLARRVNVGHAAIRLDPGKQLPMERMASKSKLVSPTSSEFDVNAPINVKKIATRLEKRRRFSAGLLEDLTSRGKIPPGAFTYTPPLPRTGMDKSLKGGDGNIRKW